MIQGGLAALFVLILMFLVLAPSSKAQAVTVRFAPIDSRPATTAPQATDPQPEFTPETTTFTTRRRPTC